MKQQGEYRFYNRADKAEIVLYGPIGKIGPYDDEGVSAKMFLDDLKKVKSSVIDVRINSSGGVVTEARAMYNALVKHRARVNVHIEGIAASAASFLAMAGDEISIGEGDIFMIHNARTSVFYIDKEARELVDEAKKLADTMEIINATIRRTYVARTGLSQDKITEWMNEEKFFTGAETYEYGFASVLIEDKAQIAACVHNLQNFKNPPKALRPRRNKVLKLIGK